MPRTLSEPEFEAIKAKLLDAAPSGLKEDEFNRYVGPALAGAIGEAENSSEPVTGSAIGRFAEGAWKNLNPMNLVGAVMHPLDTAGAIVQSHLSEADKSRQAFKEGRYSEALGHAAATAIPVIGPVAANAGERIGSGDIAGGMGEGAALLAPAGVSAARVPLGQATSAVGRTSEAIGKSGPVRRLGTYGAVAEAVRGDLPKAAVMAAGPAILEYGGRGLQRVGKAMVGAEPQVEGAAAAASGLSDVEKASLRKQGLSEAAIRKFEDQMSAPKPPPVAAAPKSIVQAATEVQDIVKEQKIKLSAQEYLAATQLIATKGIAAEDALAAVKWARGLPTDAEVAQVVAAKNARTAK